MPGYEVKFQQVGVVGGPDLEIRSLLDRQQYSDPLGEAAAVGISPATWPLFGQVWPSARKLADLMQVRELCGRRILEIGCGLALASLVIHRRRGNITASDCHPLTSGFLSANLLLNDLPELKYQTGNWACSNPLLGEFDLIIGSDVLYERDDSGSLPWFISQHAAPGAQIWIVDPDRSNRAAFNRQMAELGLTMTEQRLDVAASAGVTAYKGRMLKYGWS